LEDIAPTYVADAVVRRLASAHVEISAYWIKVTGNRDDYAAAIQRAVSGQPVLVCVVRDNSFSNPNAVAADVMGIIESNRAAAEKLLFNDGPELHCAVVLLGRSSLTVAQASSPVTLPDWFDMWAGKTVSIVIEELTWAVDVALNCPEAKVGEICEKLYTLEGSLIKRLHAVYEIRRDSGHAFMEVIRQESDGKYAELLSEFATCHANISVASAFRPSLREGASLVSRMWRVVQARSPSDLHKPVKALATALDLDPDATFESFAGLLSRPSNRDASAVHGLCRSMLASVSSGCQFVTAAAHADAYRRYPLPLVIAFSFELRNSLTQVETILRTSHYLHGN
jgi:hypothetical protein